VTAVESALADILVRSDNQAVATQPGRLAEIRWRRWYALGLVVFDLMAMAIGASVASLGRFGGLSDHIAPGNGPSYFAIGLVGSVVWVVTLGATGAYGRKLIGGGPEEYRRIFEGTIRYVAMVAAAAFLLKLNLARGFIAIAVPAALLLTIASHHLFRSWLYRQRIKGRYVRRVLVVGCEHATRDLISHFRRSGLAEFAIVGACVPGSGDRTSLGDVDVPVFGNPGSVWEVAQHLRAHVIAVADSNTLSSGGLKRLARQIEGSNVDLMAVPSLTDVAGPRITVSLAAGLPLLNVGTPELRGFRRLAKTTFDRLVAFTALVILAPFLLVIALIVRMTSRGPAFFRQERVGINGTRFRIWKFRTMDEDADLRLGEILHLNEFDAVLFKVQNDPRVTSTGRVLRKWSLDELPQLWNVLRGHMSLVGPRPPLPAEVDLYGDDAHRRLLVKPGITGLWQVSGRSALSWDETVQLDLHYVENWSLTMDLVVLAKTMRAVFGRRGAW